MTSVSDTEKQQAYTSYQNSDTQGTKGALSNPLGVSADFARYINDWQPIDMNTVDVSTLTGQSYERLEFLKMIQSSDFHVYYNDDRRPMNDQSIGNTLILNVRASDDYKSFTLTYVGFPEIVRYTVDADSGLQWNNSSRSIQVTGNRVGWILRETRDEVNGARLFYHEMMIGGEVYGFYCVPFQL